MQNIRGEGHSVSERRNLQTLNYLNAGSAPLLPTGDPSNVLALGPSGTQAHGCRLNQCVKVQKLDIHVTTVQAIADSNLGGSAIGVAIARVMHVGP